MERMEKTGETHQEQSEQIAEKIASDFCTWLKTLPEGETDDINTTTPEYIRQLFNLTNLSVMESR